jgi:hypothetical protein
MSEQIVDKLGQRRVEQILATSPNFDFKKSCKKPAFFQHHKDARMEFARKYMHINKKWNNVVFQMKKSLTLMVLID